MIDRRPRRGVLVHEREGRAGHVVGDTVSTADRLGERRLSRAKLAGDRDDERRLRDVAEPFTPVGELRFVEREMSLARERRNDRFVLHPSSTPARDGCTLLARRCAARGYAVMEVESLEKL